MAEFSPRARTLLELSEKYLFREAEKVLFGVDLRDSVGLSGVTQLDLQRMFATYAFEGGVPWMEAPLDGLFLFETVALFQPFLSLLVRDAYTGRLWGLYFGAKIPPNLEDTLKKGGGLLSTISDSWRRRDYPLFDPMRNLAVLQYQVFARPTGETQRSSLPAVASLQADIESVLEVKRGQLTPQTESRLNGLLYWLGEWREDVLYFDAFTFWMTKSNLLRIIAGFKDYTPDLEALRDRLRKRVFARAKSRPLGWYRGQWSRMRRGAEKLGGFFVLPKLRPWKEEAERLRKKREEFGEAVERGRAKLAQRRAPDLSNRCGYCGRSLDFTKTIREEWLGATRVWVTYHRRCARKLNEGTAGPSLESGPERKEEKPEVSILRPAPPAKTFAAKAGENDDDDGVRPDPRAIVRKLAYELLDAVVSPAQLPEPDAYYEAKKKRAGLIQAPDVQPRGLPMSESLERPDKPPSFYLEPGHPKGIVRALIERLRDWTVAALVDEAGEELPFSVLEAKDEEGETLPFEDSLAATPGAAWTVTESPDLELNLRLHKQDVAGWTAWNEVKLTDEERELLKWVDRHRDPPMSEKERTRKKRALANLKRASLSELKSVERTYPLHTRVIPDDIDPDVLAVWIAEEGRLWNPATCPAGTPFQDAASIVSLDTVRSYGGRPYDEPHTPTVLPPRSEPPRGLPEPPSVADVTALNRKLKGPFGLKWDEKKARRLRLPPTRPRLPGLWWRCVPPDEESLSYSKWDIQKVRARWEWMLKGRASLICSGRRELIPFEPGCYPDATPPGCWVWQQKKPPEREEIRRAWRLVYGEIPHAKKGKPHKVRQSCRNPRCVNPDHLSLDPPRPPWRGYGKFERIPERELVKVEARGNLRYHGHRYERGALFYAYKPVAEAAVRVGAVAFVQGGVP